MGLKDLFGKLFGKKQDVKHVEEKKVEEPKKADPIKVETPKPQPPKVEAPKFEPATSAEISYTRIVSKDGKDYGTDDAGNDVLVEAKNFKSFKVCNEVSLQKEGERVAVLVNGVVIGYTECYEITDNIDAILSGEKIFIGKVCAKDESRKRIQLLYCVYSPLKESFSRVVTISDTHKEDKGTGEMRYVALANACEGDEVRFRFVFKKKPNGEEDKTKKEIIVYSLYEEELGVISGEDEQTIVSLSSGMPQFLLCKIDGLKFENEDDVSTVSATVKAYRQDD